jgi:hypothetical protein
MQQLQALLNGPDTPLYSGAFEASKRSERQASSSGRRGQSSDSGAGDRRSRRQAEPRMGSTSSGSSMWDSFAEGLFGRQGAQHPRGAQRTALPQVVAREHLRLVRVPGRQRAGARQAAHHASCLGPCWHGRRPPARMPRRPPTLLRSARAPPCARRHAQRQQLPQNHHQQPQRGGGGAGSARGRPHGLLCSARLQHRSRRRRAQPGGGEGVLPVGWVPLRRCGCAPLPPARRAAAPLRPAGPPAALARPAVALGCGCVVREGGWGAVAAGEAGQAPLARG